MALLAAMLIFASRPASGQEMTYSGGPRVAKDLFRFSATWMPRELAAGEGADLGELQIDIGLTVPALRGDDRLALRFDASSDAFDRGGIEFPESGVPFPDSLKAVGVGLIYAHRFTGGVEAAMDLSLQSAGDEPFDWPDALFPAVLAIVRLPAGGRDAWRLGVAYAPMGSFAFPIPLAAYEWLPSGDVEISVGLPLGFRWRPSASFFVESRCAPISGLSAMAGWSPDEGSLTAFLAFARGRAAFSLEEADSGDGRLVARRDAVSIGLRCRRRRFAFIDLCVSYGFGRSFSLGEGRGASDAVEASPGLAASIGIGIEAP